MPVSAKIWIVIGRSALGLAVCVSLAHAEITLDGSLGPSGPVPGAPNYAISSDLGRQAGSNLFHSFGLFNINTGESATFSGPSTVENILSRVTGGTVSTIDGLLRTDFPGASPNLFLMNPSGVMFGPNAELDVQGSFHASTADFIELADGVRFNALPSAADAVLTTAPPEAFGFMDDTPAPITVDGSRLIGQEGETISLVGGDILMQGGTLSAPSGRINLASVASAGRAVLAEDGLQMTPLGEGAEVQQGDINISQASLIEVSGSGGGGVFIRGGRFTLEGSSAIETLTTGGDKGVDIGVKAKDSILVDESGIGANNVGDGNPGKIELEARTIKLENSSVLSNDVGIDDVVALGQGGTAPISIEAGSLELTDARIANESSGGKSGAIDISVTADLRMRASSIGSSTRGTGAAGDVDIKARRLTLEDVSEIAAGTAGSGRGGKVVIEASKLRLTDSFLHTSAFRFSSGDAGDMTIRADSIKLDGFTSVGTSSAGSGAGGDITIEADHLRLDGSAKVLTAGFFGNAGNISITAREMMIEGSERTRFCRSSRFVRSRTQC